MQFNVSNLIIFPTLTGLPAGERCQMKIFILTFLAFIGVLKK
jgi:hypothetical protein